jgi:hypothetical protein
MSPPESWPARIERLDISHDRKGGQSAFMYTVERTFKILADPRNSDDQKLYACILFLQFAPFECFATYPRECKAVVAGAFEYGASWNLVADAASINIAEAKRRWAGVAPPGTR